MQKRIESVEKYLNRLELDSELKRHYIGKSILVTGGAGAIGSNLIIALSTLVGPTGKVIVLDNLSSIKEKNPWNVAPLPNIMFVKGDVRSDIYLKRVFKENISIVYHLAAFFANQNSVDYPEISAEVDVIGQIKLLEYSRLAKVERFIYASSGCAIYGSYGKMPLKEDFISMHLTTPYQINKMTGEMYNNFYFHNYELQIVNCRFFNSYGPGEVPGQYRNVIPNFLYWALQGKSLPLTGTGEETRDFTYVLDLVQGLVKSGYYKEAIGENFNLASGKEVSIKSMINMVNEAAGNKAQILLKPRRKWDTKPRLLASIEKANRLIHYEPLVNFEEGFRETLVWFKDNWEIIEKLADFTPGMSSAVG
ncbi:MAG: nucleotide sugar epimerase [Ignavibacteria bacterium RIFOXYB2_FULL_35_12]|nr:MAG: nucleotide sugar epimerase [Ignavibacteria bacterium GWA2_36_19]OGU49276.1 MAG: nucleotide sugar epimerase [Ignavibacteria bacterium GWC2_35_8]OGU60881.1 MAG: nucleotide sugar epimerase [Ignavibacteria bacterium GWF2_35_20]OGU80699.1 MAG: nucleotide sugar epimerase [Ignavibacteria bacterium RIFOXYA2_FULL_35_9]OGU92089.1 MAG: nucleotide sugar epimerase [Ignavibacteria bacterium RIFOXYA12_FULL_35_25]OGU95716.1 MAG: nucleotide sugar epimerase [Ignavibacteria bacterium RIFOXYB12_FULL_35_14